VDARDDGGCLPGCVAVCARPDHLRLHAAVLRWHFGILDRGGRVPGIPFVFVSEHWATSGLARRSRPGRPAISPRAIVNAWDRPSAVRWKGDPRATAERAINSRCVPAPTPALARLSIAGEAQVLDDTLQQDSPAMTNIMQRAAPSPAALLVIEAEPTRDRFAKLLPTANLEIDTARNADEASNASPLAFML